ncbi:MAG: hypothetical protein MUF40_04305, partial [Gemmatimonadaceae bacterium]|nr:hypothetical protein [Gemmatimonadaceae bacterium]
MERPGEAGVEQPRAPPGDADRVRVVGDERAGPCLVDVERRAVPRAGAQADAQLVRRDAGDLVAVERVGAGAGALPVFEVAEPRPRVRDVHRGEARDPRARPGLDPLVAHHARVLEERRAVEDARLHDRVRDARPVRGDVPRQRARQFTARPELDRQRALRPEIGIEAALPVGAYLQLGRRRRLEARGDVRVGREPRTSGEAGAHVAAPRGQRARAAVVAAVDPAVAGEVVDDVEGDAVVATTGAQEEPRRRRPLRLHEGPDAGDRLELVEQDRVRGRDGAAGGAAPVDAPVAHALHVDPGGDRRRRGGLGEPPAAAGPHAAEAAAQRGVDAVHRRRRPRRGGAERIEHGPRADPRRRHPGRAITVGTAAQRHRELVLRHAPIRTASDVEGRRGIGIARVLGEGERTGIRRLGDLRRLRADLERRAGRERDIERAVELARLCGAVLAEAAERRARERDGADRVAPAAADAHLLLAE